MNLIFSDQAWADYQHWQETDKKTVRRIHELPKEIKRKSRGGNEIYAGSNSRAWVISRL